MRTIPRAARGRVFPWLLLAGLCCLWSVLRAPVPGPNEPHYLTKARHFWNPEWCQGDLFLESSNPHALFYLLMGWLPAWIGFETTALLGRLAASLLLSAGWLLATSRLMPGRIGPIVSLGLFLLWQTLGNFSGEWIVGGVEAKTFSYGFAFLAAGLIWRRAFAPAAAALGLCFSFHPVIGGWVLLASAIAWGMLRLVGRWERSNLSHGSNSFLPAGSGDAAASNRSMSIRLLPPICFVLTAWPGLWASWPILMAGGSAEADLIMIERRLPHHLDPLRFPASAYVYYAALLALCGLLARIPPGRHQKEPATTADSPATTPLTAIDPHPLWMLRAVTGASLLFVLGGILMAWGERPFSNLPGAVWRAWCLKFYPFRLADVMIPLLLAVEIGRHVALGSRLLGAHHPVGRLTWAGLAVGLPCVVVSFKTYPDRPASRMEHSLEQDWLAICAWMREHLPDDALLWAVNERWAVKWYAERAEYVNYKDVPQDPPSLLEWQRRQQVLRQWVVRTAPDGLFSLDDLRELRQETGITHLVCRRMGPIEGEPLHRLGRFRVYHLPE